MRWSAATTSHQLLRLVDVLHQVAQAPSGSWETTALTAGRRGGPPRGSAGSSPATPGAANPPQAPLLAYRTPRVPVSVKVLGPSRVGAVRHRGVHRYRDDTRADPVWFGFLSKGVRTRTWVTRRTAPPGLAVSRRPPGTLPPRPPTNASPPSWRAHAHGWGVGPATNPRRRTPTPVAQHPDPAGAPPGNEALVLLDGYVGQQALGCCSPSWWHILRPHGASSPCRGTSSFRHRG